MQIFSSLTLQTAIRRTGYILRGRSGAAGVKNAEIQAAPMHANRTAVQANVGANLYIPSTVNTQMNLVLLHFFGPLVKISVACRIRIKMRKLCQFCFQPVLLRDKID